MVFVAKLIILLILQRFLLKTFSMAIEIIRKGPSFKGELSYLGLGLIALGAVLATLDLTVFIPIIIALIGLILFPNYEILEVEYDKRTIRRRNSYIFFSLGKWESIDKYSKLLLGANHQAFKLISPAHPIFQKEIKVKNYDIYILDALLLSKSFLFRRCKNIKDAQNKLKYFSEKLGIEAEDTIKTNWQKAALRKR
jgi:hypothetical protein